MDQEVYVLPKYEKRLIFTSTAIKKLRRYEDIVSKLGLEICCPFIESYNDGKEIVIDDLGIPKKVIAVEFPDNFSLNDQINVPYFIFRRIIDKKQTVQAQNVFDRLKQKFYEKKCKKSSFYILEGENFEFKRKSPYACLPEDADIISSKINCYANRINSIGYIHNHPEEANSIDCLLLSHWDITEIKPSLEKNNFDIQAIFSNALEIYYLDKEVLEETERIINEYYYRYFGMVFNFIWSKFMSQLKEENMFRRIS